MLGWGRAAARCIAVLDLTRKNAFAGWDTFPAELQGLFATSTVALYEYCQRNDRPPENSTPPLVPAQNGRYGDASPEETKP